MKLRANTFIFPRIMKILGIAMILFALTIWAIVYLNKGVTDFLIPASVIGPGLMFIFFSREKVDDERIHHIKFKSLVAGFVTAYLFTLSWHTINSHEFVVIVLSLSTAAFYLLKNKL